jgi:hypothetical protein
MKREKYIAELKQIKQNCEYTAETHHNIANVNKKMAIWFQTVPAVAAALSGLLVAGQVIPIWWAWITTISAVVAAVGTVLNPLKDYYDHLNAAKSFTILKHDARSLYETFESGMGDSTFQSNVKTLHERYNDLLRFVPPTNNSAFEKARRRIKSGIHQPDQI